MLRLWHRRWTRRRGDAGVTLIEMMVVLVIIAIIAALIVPNVIGRPDEARVTVAKSDIRTIAASLELYRLDARVYQSWGYG
jgi:general secretion pathway protein G